MTLRYVKGDITSNILLENEGLNITNDIFGKPVILIHVCNNAGGWGAGFVNVLSSKYPEPEKIYRNAKVLTLGDIQMVKVLGNMYVINMIAQTLYYRKKVNLDYNALAKCLESVNKIAEVMDAVIIGPKFGAGLAGGDWQEVEKLIKTQFNLFSRDEIIFELDKK